MTFSHPRHPRPSTACKAGAQDKLPAKRESGNPDWLRLFGRLWVPAFAGMTMVLSFPLAAQTAVPPAPYAYTQLEDPALEAEATALMQTLRCLKCQSQSIADSDAPMAGDMRHQVRSRIAAGESPAEVRAWLVQRYGDYVSYQPEVSATTWPLFAIPALLLAIVLLVLLRRLGRNRSDSETTAAP